MGKIAGVLGQLYDNALFQESAIVMIKLFKPGRSKNWYAWYKKNGKQDQFSCHTSNEREAYRYAVKEVERRLSLVAQPKYSSQTLEEFAEEYLDFVTKAKYKQKSILAIESSFRLFIKRIGNKPLVKVKREECEKFIHTNQPSDFTARKHYGHLCAAFRKAVLWERIPTNHFLSFPKPSPPEVEPEYFTEAEYRKLYDFIPTDHLYQRRLRNISLLAFETGIRLAEARHLKRTDVNLHKSLLYVLNSSTFRTKSKKNRAVPLSENAKIAIHDQLRDLLSHKLETVRESPYLFPNEQGEPISESEIVNKFRLYSKEVFPDRKLSFHKLRHGYGTRLIIAGVPVPEIKTAMGHSTIQMTERYAHLDRVQYQNLTKALNEAPSIKRPTYTTPEAEEFSVLQSASDMSDEFIPVLPNPATHHDT